MGETNQQPAGGLRQAPHEDGEEHPGQDREHGRQDLVEGVASVREGKGTQDQGGDQSDQHMGHILLVYSTCGCIPHNPMD
jgi:hypothetical protein